MGRAGEYTSLRARVGGLSRSASCDMRQLSQLGAAGLRDKFTKEVDPDNILDAGERARRANALRRAHFVRLALLSAKARRRKRG